MKARHFCFEGMPGSGKTTQAKLLTTKLRGEGISVEYVKSPNGNPFGNKITKAVFSENPTKMAELYAFWACYCHLVESIIQPMLLKGTWVVSDKGLVTSYANIFYRHKGLLEKDIFNSMVSSLNESNAIYPDTIFFLDIPLEKSFKRKEDDSKKSCRDILNKGNIDEALAYTKISTCFSNWQTIDALNDINIINNTLWSFIKNKFL